MAYVPKDPVLADHLAWLGYVQPEGLVVSAPALVDAQVVIDRAQLGDLQRRFAEHVADLPLADGDTPDMVAGVADIPRLLTDFLEWQDNLIVGWDPSRPLPDALSVALPEFQETLRPSYAVTNPKAKEGASPWLLLVQTHSSKVDLDRPTIGGERGWPASPAKKFERLLRETGVTIGLLTNGTEFRLVYAPPKENSGSLKFSVGPMSEISGRLILGAFHLLLNSWTLFTAPGDARLPGLLQRSRDYQASVSEVLAEQVLHALYELLRGFEAADGRVKGALLRELAAKDPHSIYGGLVTVLLRLVFTLFAEDRGLLPLSGLYVRHYSVRGLFERLRNDAEHYPDTMDHRFGAWPQLLALFRMIHRGCDYAEIKMPARAGHLFDPDRYPFLEGRLSHSAPIGALPLVSDGTLHRILEKLCILEGERVSYRTLDVEEIGSVYQTIMGFAVETAAGTAIALKGKRKNGGVPASPVVSLEQLLAIPTKDRAKWLKENADTELNGEADKRLKAAATVDDLLVALEKRIDRHATPAPVAQGGLVLQPTDERRRSGSHYTPRSFTEPIVRKTLEPILKRFGEQPTPALILELKICDIAVGSAAFLVETCRQLADVLVRAWRVNGGRPVLPPDETEELLAMRTIAQRCLYGVDRNPMAVDLAKLSLWLATLAKDHPFTFLDHSIRAGDSLVGLTAKQIAAFTWGRTAGVQRLLGQDRLEKRIAAAIAYRRVILEGGDLVLPSLKTQKLQLADEALDEIRFVGDLAIAAFFCAEKEKARHELRDDLLQRYTTTAFDIAGRTELKRVIVTLRGGRFPVAPFHWEIEFPEVFDRKNPGFDAVVGNPPFMGGWTISSALGPRYLDCLLQNYIEAQGTSDIVAYFFRRAYSLLNDGGAFGLIATNTVAQGDTKESGLNYICSHGGWIFCCKRRVKWPGQAAVVVSTVFVSKNAESFGRPMLDDKPVERISAFLFEGNQDHNPPRLAQNTNKSFRGAVIYGQGFILNEKEVAELVARNKSNAERIYRYLGGEEINSDAQHRHHRFVINFGTLPLEKAAQWPDLLRIVEEKVKPERDAHTNNAIALRQKQYWWRFRSDTPFLFEAIGKSTRCLVQSQVSSHLVFAFVRTDYLFAHTVNVFAFDTFAALCVLQSRPHAVWALFFASSLEDRLRYNPNDCFETFPFPAAFETNAALEEAGREYYEFRAALMQDLWLGLTEIYNLFHAPDDEALARLGTLFRKRSVTSDWRTAEGVPTDRSPLTLYTTPAAALIGVQRLRTLHAAMDAAVLTAYGWTDLLPRCTCDFLLDYEEDESEETTGRQKKKPWRYRWPDEVRDEVLARLLKLNAERAEQERLAGTGASFRESDSPKKIAAGVKRGRKPPPSPAVPVELPLPADFRLSFQNPLLYSVSLVVSLLSEAGGSLPWPQLLDSFVLATEPKLLVRLATKDDTARAKDWANRWNEAAKPEMIIPALRQLGGNNLAVERAGSDLTFALQDGPRAHASEDLAYDAWLALRVAGVLAPQAVPIPMRATWTKQAEAVLVA